MQERRNQLVHPPHVKPELVATAPNQVWCWDITRLRSTMKWQFFYLYVLLESSVATSWAGWWPAPRTPALLGADRGDLQQTRHRPRTLTLHSDRGGPMRAKTTAELLVDLGVAASFSRPRVSNDNPFSEAQFKTLKYRPEFPERFAGIDHARMHLRAFFAWYNDEHRHSGIGFMTPAAVHFGHARRSTRNASRPAGGLRRPPQRFKGRCRSRPPLPESSVSICPPPTHGDRRCPEHDTRLLTNFHNRVSQSH